VAFAATVAKPSGADPAAVWAYEIVSGYSAERILRLMAAVLLGKSSGHPDAPAFRDLLDTEDAVAADVDSDGNRSSVELGP
jgi:hypothetical protein